MNREPNTQPQNDAYEPPRIETVLTPDELEREVAYAGANLVTAS